jgi:type II secretory pathway component PulF
MEQKQGTLYLDLLDVRNIVTMIEDGASLREALKGQLFINGISIKYINKTEFVGELPESLKPIYKEIITELQYLSHKT